MPFIPIIIIILVVVLILVLATNLKVVQQSKAYVIERLGAFHSVWGVGIHFKVPFLERVAKVVSLKEQVVDFPPQPVITKDNVTMQIDTVLYFQITDPKLYAYGVERPMSAIENLTRHHHAQHHRRHGSGADPHQPRHHQLPDARPAGRGHRPLGHQGQPGRGQEHSARLRTYRAPWRSR